MQALQKSLGELPQRKPAAKASLNESANSAGSKKQSGGKRQSARTANG
jgi:hypothetical protein